MQQILRIVLYIAVGSFIIPLTATKTNDFQIIKYANTSSKKRKTPSSTFKSQPSPKKQRTTPPDSFALTRNIIKNNPFALHDACYNGELTILPGFLELYKEENLSINDPNEMGMTPLHCAVAIGSKEITRLLLKNNADISLKTIYEQKTPYEIARDGNHEILKHYLERKEKKLFAQNLLQNNPFAFHEACKDKNVEMIDALVKYLPNPNLQDNAGNGAIHYAAQHGDIQTIKMLARFHSNLLDLELKDNDGRNPLHTALSFQHVAAHELLQNMQLIQKDPHILINSLKNLRSLVKQRMNISKQKAQSLSQDAGKLKKQISDEINQLTLIFESLIFAGAEVNAKNSKGWTPLLLVAHLTKDLNLIKLLIDAGAQINEKNNAKMSPLHYACSKRNNINIIRLLIDAGANINEINSTAQTPLHLAASLKDNNDTMQLLIAEGAHLDAQNIKGQTPLYLSLLLPNNLLTIQTFVDAKANVNIKNLKGTLPLHLAAKYNNFEALEMLTKECTHVNYYDNKGLTPLHYAVHTSDIELIAFLIQLGADVNAIGKVGLSPLHVAAARQNDNKRKEVVQLLIDHNANINVLTHQNKSPLFLAIECENFEVANILHQRAPHQQEQRQTIVLDIIYNEETGRFEQDSKFNNFFAFQDKCKNQDISALNPLDDYTPVIDLSDVYEGLTLDCDTQNNDAINLFRKTINEDSNNLINACKANNIGHVKMLLESGKEVNIQEIETGNTPLHIAAMRGYEELTRLLIAHGAHCEMQDGQDQYAFQVAASEHLKHIIILAAFDTPTYHAYLVAEIFDHCREETLIKTIKVLPTSTPLFDEDSTILHLALNHDFDETAKLIIEKSSLALFEIYDNTDDGYCALYSAISHKKYYLAKMIIDRLEPKNLNLMQGDHSALYWAITEGHSDIAKEMIFAGAIMDEDEKKELKELGYEEFLLAFEARDALAANPFALHEACSNNEIAPIPHLLQLSEKQGFDINAYNDEGLTPLHCAVIQGNEEMVRILIQHGAREAITTSDNQTTQNLTNDHSLKMLLAQAQNQQKNST